MFRFIPIFLLLPLAAARAVEPGLTIYNQNFAVVRGAVPLDLHEGVNEIRFSDITAHLEPSSIILRDPSGRNEFQVLEQNYRADPVTQSMLLSLFEGQTIDFEVDEYRKGTTIVPGRIIRSGYNQARSSDGEEMKPIIEMNGKLRFELPGRPLFPKLTDDTILKPELSWKISARQGEKFEAEIAYVTGEMSWSADYNVIMPETGNELQVTGWVTINNRSGKRFEKAQTKLVAGNVKKVLPSAAPLAYAPTERVIVTGSNIPVQEKAFDEYHLYTQPRPLTLRDQETKQVEFIRAAGVQVTRLYVYDSAGYEGPEPALASHGPILEPAWGGDPVDKIGVINEFKNSEANHLGIPLPKGRWRFYRRDNDQRLEFTGENEQNHTAKDETLRIFTGTAFDLAVERLQSDFAVDRPKHTMDEAFEIKLRNHKKEPVEIHVVEHLNRWQSWEVLDHSDPFTKKSAHAIEFVVSLKPDGEKSVRYRVRYTQLPTNSAG